MIFFFCYRQLRKNEKKKDISLTFIVTTIFVVIVGDNFCCCRRLRIVHRHFKLGRKQVWNRKQYSLSYLR